MEGSGLWKGVVWHGQSIMGVFLPWTSLQVVPQWEECIKGDGNKFEEIIHVCIKELLL